MFKDSVRQRKFAVQNMKFVFFSLCGGGGVGGVGECVRACVRVCVCMYVCSPCYLVK